MSIPYSAEISRQNPSCFVFVIDQSGSMADSFSGGEVQRRKADGVADAINNFLRNLTIRCAKSEGVRDYFHVGVVGYGAAVGSAFTGRLSGREIVPISEIADGPTRVEERTIKTEDGAGGLVEEKKKIPIWFDPVANGGTPMCNAFRLVEKAVKGFIDSHPGCFPPVVIHFTDGESTDGDPTSAMGLLLLFHPLMGTFYFSIAT